MSNHENARGSSASAKPSLVGHAPTDAGKGADTTAPMRMLDGIEATRGRGAARQPGGAARGLAWLGAGIAVLAIAAWWALRSGPATEPAPARASAANVAPTSTDATAEPTRTAAAPAVAAPARSSEAARIEASAEPRRVVPPAMAAPASASAAKSLPRAPATVQAAAARPAPVVAAGRIARGQAAPAGVRESAPRSTDEADVALVRAMLARLSAAPANPAEALSVNATIGQLAAKCQAGAPDDAIAAFECRREICADYWGRVEACPMALAPKGH